MAQDNPPIARTMTAAQMLGKRLLIKPLLNGIFSEAFEVTVEEVEPVSNHVRIPKMQGGIYKWVYAGDVAVLAELPVKEKQKSTNAELLEALKAMLNCFSRDESMLFLMATVSGKGIDPELVERCNKIERAFIAARAVIAKAETEQH